MQISKLSPYFFGVVVAVSAHGLYRKHTQIESMSLQCMAKYNNQNVCACLKDHFEQNIPFYKTSPWYNIIQGKEKIDREGEKLGADAYSACSPRVNN